MLKHTKAAAEKQAGPISETLSIANPLNSYFGGSLLAGGAALGMPTRSLQQQANYDSTDNALRAIANVLVPGYGPYNAFKRIGAGIRSPEMKAIKADRERDKARRELESIQKSMKENDNMGKAAGWKTELAGSVLNPINLLIGNKLGAGAAALTKTRTLNEQSESDDSTWSNLFIPGQAQYNYWKRIGAATRSPEMLAMRRQATIDRLEREAGMKKKKNDNEKQSKVYEASEAVDGMHVKHTKMNHKKCTPGEFGAMVKESADSVIAPQPRPALGPMANRALKSQVPAYQKRMHHGQNAMDKIMGNPALSQPAPVALKSAHDFGAYVKQSFLGQVQQQVQQHLPAIGTGAAMGAGLAGLHGFMSPGEEDEYDAQGRVVGRKQRSRLGTMLSRALMGAGVGSAAMGAGSMMFPQYVNPALQKLYGMFQSQQPQQAGARYTPNVYPANTTDYAALDADPNSALDVNTRVTMPQTSVPQPTAAEIPDLDAAGVQ